MKIRNPWVIKAMALLLACVIRLWIGTLRFRYRPRGRNLHPHRLPPEERYIYVFWHENMLLPAYHYARQDCCVLISQHADGQLIAEACRHLGFRTVRGSTTRGGMEAVRELLRLSQRGNHIGVTPDGPRGPRRHVHPGVVYLASRTGMGIIAVGVGFQNPWRTRSWDQFALPKPWTDAALVTSDPMFVPPDLERGDLEPHRARVEAVLHDVTADAEYWAEHGHAPTSSSASAKPLQGSHLNGDGRATDEQGPRAA